jgi:hypothetical protein
MMAALGKSIDSDEEEKLLVSALNLTGFNWSFRSS